MIKIVLLRHGESIWNKEKKFTGWTDIDLSDKGKQEARKAGILLKNKGFSFDIAYTSLLKRAIRTLWIVLDELDLMWIPTYRSWRLNERHYGSLQGKNKVETAKKHGDEQVLLWRRSYEVLPPPLKKFASDKKYKYLEEKYKPLTESLKDTIVRLLPYWHEEITPTIKSGKKVLIVAHGNSLRGIVMHLDKLNGEEIIKINIPTGIPLVYELNSNLQTINKYYLD